MIKLKKALGNWGLLLFCSRNTTLQFTIATIPFQVPPSYYK